MRIMKISVLTILLSVILAGASLAVGLHGVPADQAQPLLNIPLVSLPALDVEALAEDDVWREEEGMPDRFAMPRQVNLTPDNSGTWETLPSGEQLWRLRVGCPEVLSLNLGFTGFQLPLGASLLVYSADNTGPVFEFYAQDNHSSRQLWTPVLVTDELVVELKVPASAKEDLLLELGRVGCGYRYFGQDTFDKSGLCNIDVICPEGDDWREDIPSVGRFIYDGSYRCTGAMINNTAQDQRPLFLTAEHCEVTADIASSMIVYWNYESPTCGQQGGGTELEFTYGDTLLAEFSTTDFRLLELVENPDPDFGVTYAGWDRSGDVPTSAVAIHHPSADEKSISFEDDELRITSYLAEVGPGNSTHLMVVDWDLGTTEPGSSGSPLFDADHHIVGQLHGGYAACNNDRPDWYGRLSVSWTGGGTTESRLSDFLDPEGTGVMALNRFGSEDPDPLPPGEMVLSLSLVAPNPFMGYTEVTYRLNQAGTVTVRVMNMQGQIVRNLGTFQGEEGENVFAWDGHDDNDRPTAAGLYVFYLESAGQTARGQAVRLR